MAVSEVEAHKLLMYYELKMHNEMTKKKEDKNDELIEQIGVTIAVLRHYISLVKLLENRFKCYIPPLEPSLPEEITDNRFNIPHVDINDLPTSEVRKNYLL